MNALPPIKKKRDELAAGEVLCTYCSAKCCRYFALPIERPKTLRDFDFIRWYLLHDAASVFIEDGIWYLLVHTVCHHLADDNRCKIYETRPNICREYSIENCEYEDNFTYEFYFETADQVSEYVEARFHAMPDGERFRSPKPTASLPII